MRKSQKHAAQFIIDNKKCALHLGVGFGKTLATIHALKEISKGKELNILVLSTVLVIYNTWPNELKKWGSDFDVILLDDKPKKRIEQLYKPMKGTTITLCNVDKLSWLIQFLDRVDKWPYDIVVLDESSLFKKQSSKRFKALKPKLLKTDRVIELSATPMQKPLDIWSQMYFLDKGERLGKAISHYQRDYLYEVSRRTARNQWSDWKITKENEVKVFKKLSDICFSLQPEDVDYPDKNLHTIEMELCEDGAKIYKQFEKEYVAHIQESESTIVVKSAAILTGKLRHVCNGAVYDEDGCLHNIHKQKAEKVAELIATEGNFLLAYHFKSDWEQIKDTIKINNMMHIKDEGAIDKWNKGHIKLLCAQVQSASHGLNLQFGGSNIIWFGVPYSLEYYEQLNGRLHRPGQRDSVNIYHILMTHKGRSIEHDILDVLASKKKLSVSFEEYITMKTLQNIREDKLVDKFHSSLDKWQSICLEGQKQAKAGSFKPGSAEAELFLQQSCEINEKMEGLKEELLGFIIKSKKTQEEAHILIERCLPNQDYDKEQDILFECNKKLKEVENGDL